MPLQVELVSPERIAYSGTAQMVICRVSTGDIAFLPGHVPFIGTLVTNGVRVIGDDGGEQVIAVHQGFVEVSPQEGDITRVTILSDVAELAADIDVERAREAKARAEQAISSDPGDAEAAAALRRANVRLTVAGAV